jgi:hypothetical protein
MEQFAPFFLAHLEMSQGLSTLFANWNIFKSTLFYWHILLLSHHQICRQLPQ